MNEILFRFVNDTVKNPLFDRLMPLFSDKDFVVIPGAVALGLLVYFGRRRARLCVIALLLALLVSDIGSEKVLKNLFAAPRPYAAIEGVHLHRSGRWIDYDPAWAPFDGRSSHAFPSSHAANAAAIALALFLSYRRTAWATVPLALLVGLSRVYTGNHFPGDVLAGYAWGAACGGGAHWIVARIARRWPASDEAGAVRPPLPVERRAFLWLLAAWTGLNFLFVHVSGFCLAGDEAQYWDWARRLALGYYSKPPMIAYAIAALTAAGGNQEWAIRSGAVMLSSGTLALVYALTLRIARRERAALLAAAVLMAMPASWAGSVLMTIDPLLVFFWALGMYAFHRAVHGEKGMWWLTGLALGLGLLSKYTMLFLFASFALYLLLVDRRPWRTAGPYVALAVAALCCSGAIYWNWSHDWISLRHTAAIGAQDEFRALEAAGRVGAYLGGQAGVASPVLFVLMLWAVARCAGRFTRDGDAAFLALCFGAIFVLYAAVSITHEPQANWPICAYVAGAPALAGVWMQCARPRWMRALLAAGIALGCLAGLATRSTGLIYLLGSPAGDDAGRVRIAGLEFDAGKDPTNRLKGGPELGRALSRYTGLDPEHGPFPFSDRYQLTAAAAFYTDGRPRAYCMNVGDRRYNQYDLWGGWPDLAGRDGLFVTGGSELKARLFIDDMVKRGFFERGEFLETVEVRRGGVLIKTYTISRMYAYSGKPWTPDAEKF
ncbi:MAG: glycosyltransferase family 39 protein [Candidatus Hydrogenedentes bacterium]|nr:glycosyltransferase family 39 protein [Candidatus Hydrogenedentota bacterium]